MQQIEVLGDRFWLLAPVGCMDERIKGDTCAGSVVIAVELLDACLADALSGQLFVRATHSAAT